MTAEESTKSPEASALEERIAALESALAAHARREADSEHALRDRDRAIARRLQASLLPRDLAVKGFEIAAAMEPAADIGGDYYDVVPTGDGCWVGIGDVSGRGLEAGVVVLMVQSAVAALVRANPTASPAALVRSLNSALFDGMRARMKSDDFVTFCLMRCNRDGGVEFAGAHEEIVLCRASSGKCQMVGTPGTWLGVKSEIGRVTVDVMGHLEPGDVMVLYTDGVTEAMDASGGQFGTERLAAVIERERAAPTTLIRQRILQAVHDFSARLTDDMTLLILRYVGVGDESAGGGDGHHA